MVPFLAILAAYLWTGGWLALKEHLATRTGKVIILLACMGIMLMFLNWGLELWRDAGKLASLIGPNGNMTYFSY
jgi:hypothetical protein